MHDCIVWALLKGVPGSLRPWRDEPAPTFLCPVPGYDRHFGLCEAYGIRMIPVHLTGQGPDMNEVERLAADPAVKGLWCVPKYSNPTGDIVSEEAALRLAAMPAGAPDFRLFWDDAYAVHHLTARTSSRHPEHPGPLRRGQPSRQGLRLCLDVQDHAWPGAGVARSSPALPANVQLVPGASRHAVHRSRTRSISCATCACCATIATASTDTWTAASGAAGTKIRRGARRARAPARGQPRRWPPGHAREGGYFIAVASAKPGTASRASSTSPRAAGAGADHCGRHMAATGKTPRTRMLRLAPSYPLARGRANRGGRASRSALRSPRLEQMSEAAHPTPRL